MVLVRLPEELRSELKQPLGIVESEVREVEGRLVAVGDVVTRHFVDADIIPDLSLVDGRTKRREVDPEVEEAVDTLEVVDEVKNPAGTLTRELLESIAENIDSDGTVYVDGEEDLAVLPAILLADEGDTVVYGQPGEGMVYVEVDDESRETAEDLLLRMDVEDESELRRLLGL